MLSRPESMRSFLKREACIHSFITVSLIMHKIFRMKKKYGGRDRAISTVIIVRISRLLAVFVLLVTGIRFNIPSAVTLCSAAAVFVRGGEIWEVF